MGVWTAIGAALRTAGAMGWEILWALILGFALSGAVQAVVRLGLQPEVSSALAMTARAWGFRYGLSRRIRSRKSNCVKVPWMPVGPKFEPCTSLRAYLVSRNTSNAGENS